jgi:hypothetical protein
VVFTRDPGRHGVLNLVDLDNETTVTAEITTQVSTLNSARDGRQQLIS